MGGFVRDEKCAFLKCRKRAPIIYDTAVDTAMILVFCQEHVPKGKLVKEVRVVKGEQKGKRFGLALLFNEEGINWIKKCKANADVNLNMDPAETEVIKQ